MLFEFLDPIFSLFRDFSPVYPGCNYPFEYRYHFSNTPIDHRADAFFPGGKFPFRLSS